MSLNDRGNKKWTAIMLPEHVKMLKEVFEEDDLVEMPIIDEQQQMENDLMLQAALHNGSIVEIKYYENGKFATIKGGILFIDLLRGNIRMDTEELNMEYIIEVNL